MKRLPLYENVNQPIQEIDGLDQDQSCSRCALHQYTPSGQRCLSAEGEPGGILVISDYPGEYERKLGRPMAGPAGRWLRELLERVAPGEKVAYTNALGCKPPEGWEAFEESVGACRPYVRKIIDEAQPKLILLMGPYAGLSVLGHTYQPLSVRKGYAWLGNTPVFLMPNPAAAVRNRLIARAFEEDLRWALTEAQPNGHSELQQHFEFHYHEIETVEDAEAAFTDLIANTSEQNPTSMDCETSGMQFEPDFRIECMAFSNGSSAYVFPRSAIENPEIAPILITLLEAGYFTSWNGLYDFCAIYNESFLRKYNHGKPVRMRLWSDARLKRKLYEADASGKLAIAADLVGMGGHKLEAHTLLKEICNELNKLALSMELTPKGKVRKRPELKYVQEAQVPEVWFEYLKSFDTEKFAYRFMDKKIMHRYCARDAHSTWHLEQWCERRMAELKDVDLGMVWREVTQPAMWAYCEMTLNGIPINKAKLTMFSQWLDVEMEKLKRELQVEVGDDDWNPKSDPQLRAEMERRNLKTKRKTDGGKSGERKMKVDKESLEDFEDNPFIQKVARYRLLHHTQSNFAAGLIPYIRSDGRVHPTFLLDGTGCLPAGELVLTSRGYIPAEEVRVGDSVISHAGVPRKVIRTQINPPSEIYRVELSNGTVLRTTPDHKFYDGSNWIRADELSIGDQVKVHSLSGEIWAPISDWPFEVSTWGRVRHAKTKTIYNLYQKDRWGHLKVTLSRNGGRNRRSGDVKDFAIHRLVLMAHGRKPLPNEEVRHRNGIAWDNTIENLTWGSSLENHQDASEHGALSKRCIEHPQSKLTEGDVARIRSFERPKRGGRFKNTTAVSDATLAAEYGVTRELIRDVRTGLRWLPENHIGKRAKFHDSKVVSITREAAEVTYGAEVEIDHSHVTGGVVTHNTGRASSSEPNMFNQLKGRDEQSAELGKKLRACYEAPPGWVILEHDQGQIEVRMAAFLSGDKNLSDPLKDPNADFHMVNAKAFAKAQGKDPNAVTKMDRDAAKTSVFASFYEIPCELPFLLSVRLDVDRAVGADLASAMQTSFPQMLQWMHDCYAESWQRGYSITHWKGKPARRRPLWELAKNPPTLHELEEGLQNEKRNRRGAESPKSKYDTTSARATYNGDNQGSAVDVITSALWPVHCWLQSNTNGGQLFLTIYDSIMTMVRQEDAQKTHEAVVRIMTDPSRLPGIPMVVDGKWGPTWAALEKIK